MRNLALGLLAAAAIAGPARAEKLVDAGKVLPFLDAYWKIPPAERNRFTMAYALRQEGRPLTAPVWLVTGTERLRLPLSAEGRITRLPTAAQLAGAKIAVDLPEKAKVSVGLGIEPVLAPAAEMDAQTLAAALTQAQSGARKAAGVMRFAMPKLERLVFEGVPGGVVAYADGRTAPLPVQKGNVVFAPKDHPGARTLRFPKAPSRVQIG